jgi:ankyrin repeat protein
LGAEHKLEIIKALVEVGANPVCFMDTGAHTLTSVAANPDVSEETIHYLLSLPGVKDLIDVPMRPRTAGWRFRFKLTRLLVRLGSKKALFRAISLWEGQTALCSAALNGNAVAMKMLVREGGANTQLRNARGLSALDQARLVAGKHYYHPLLQPEQFVPREGTKQGEETKGKE